jgi:hypothetical protein
MVAFGAPMLVAAGLIFLGAASLIPFAAGLFGFSTRVAFICAGCLVFCHALLEAWTFSDGLRYQSALQLLLVDLNSLGSLGLILLLAFIFSHWLGTRIRAVAVWLVRGVCPTRT